MTPNDDALQCAGYIECDGDLIEQKIAAHIRRLVAENEAMLVGMRDREDRVDRMRGKVEAQAALLRQAVEAMDELQYAHTDKSRRLYDAAIAAIRQHLEGKT